MPNITANAGAVQLLGVDGAGSIGVQITGTWIGTLGFQMSQDGGTTWNNVNAWPVSAGATVQSTTANGNWAIPCVAGTYYQVVATAWTSGTAVVTLQTIKSPVVLAPKTNASGEVVVQVSSSGGVTTVQGANADGGVPSNPLVGGVLETASIVRLLRAVNAPFADTSIGKGVQAVNIPCLQNSGSLAAPGTVSLAPIGAATSVLVVFTGTYTGATATFKGSYDGGVTYPLTLTGYPQAGGAALTGITTAATTGQWLIPVSGFSAMQVSVSAIASGTITIALEAGVGAWPNVPQVVQGPAADGTTFVGNPVPAGISQGVNVRAWQGEVGISDAYSGNGLPMMGLRLKNGSSSYDALKSAVVAANTTGAGLLGAGLLAFDGTNYQLARLAKTDGSAVGTTGILASAIHAWDGSTYQGILSDANKSLKVALMNTAGGAFVAGSNFTDANSASQILPVVLGAHNGTNFDKLRTASATGAAGGTAGFLGTALMTWNGTGYQPAQGDTTGTPRYGHYRTTIKSTPTVGTGTAYASNDLIGTKNTLANAVRVSGGTGKIQNVAVSDKSGASADAALAVRVWYFDSDPSGSTFTDNGALNLVDADITKVIGFVDLTAGGFAAGAVVWSKTGCEMDFTAQGSTSLFMALEARGAITANGGTTDWQISTTIDQD